MERGLDLKELVRDTLVRAEKPVMASSSQMRTQEKLPGSQGEALAENRTTALRIDLQPSEPRGVEGMPKPPPYSILLE